MPKVDYASKGLCLKGIMPQRDNASKGPLQTPMPKGDVPQKNMP